MAPKKDDKKAAPSKKAAGSGGGKAKKKVRACALASAVAVRDGAVGMVQAAVAAADAV